MNKVGLGIALATLLWFVMFSPWTAPLVPFWYTMAASGILLTLLSLRMGGNPFTHRENPVTALVLGSLLAALLWGMFWVGDKVSQWMFSFAGTQIDMIYNMKADNPDWIIGLLLLLVIGPAEELFWRGFVQRLLSQQHGQYAAFIITWCCYTGVHVWSGNIMLLLAAAACGFCWGGLYLLFPRRLGAITVSHALWDVAAFVLFPF